MKYSIPKVRVELVGSKAGEQVQDNMMELTQDVWWEGVV